jgi:hypothetical protein
MRDTGAAERRSFQRAGLEVRENFDELATLIQRAIDRIADGPDSAETQDRLKRAKAAADRGAALARELPEQ